VTCIGAAEASLGFDLRQSSYDVVRSSNSTRHAAFGNEKTDWFIEVGVHRLVGSSIGICYSLAIDEIRWDEKAGLRRDAVYAPKLSTCFEHKR
jgi:hypothetical protein